MSLATGMARTWRSFAVAVSSVALLATVLIIAAAPNSVDAQQTVTCYAIADSNEPGNLNSEGQVDTLIRIENALTNPNVTVIGGNGGLGTQDAEAFAIRPLPDGSFEVVDWETGSNLFSINPDTADTSPGPFSIPGKVEGLTWSGTNDDVAANDLLWASYGSPANQVVAYSTTGLVVFGPYTTEVGALNSIVGIAWDPTTGNLYGIITDDTDDTDVIQIDTANGNPTFIGDTDIDMEGLGFAPTGQLVGTTGNDGANAFHLISKANGQATLQSDLSAITGAFDFESVDCVSDGPPPEPLPPLETICYAISDSISAAISDAGSPDTLVRVDTSNGSTTVVGLVDGGDTISVEAFAIRPTAAGPELFGFDPDTGGRLFTIDENDGSVTNIASGLGALGDVDGMTFSGVNDNDPNNDVLWMSIRNVGAPSDQLVSVDPASGAILSGPVNMDASGVPGVTVNDIDAIAWDPVTGQVFATAGSGAANSLVTVDPATGAVTNVGSFGINDIEGLGFSNSGADNGFLFGTTGKEDGATASALYLINKTDPSASQQVVDLFAATGVTDFESVDCLDQVGPAPLVPGVITAGLVGTCTVPNVNNQGKISVTITYASGEAPVDYSVQVTSQPAATGTINAGDEPAMVMTTDTLADGNYSVQVTNTTSGVIIANEIVPISCFVPPETVLSAEITSECADQAGKITATLVYESGVTEGTFVVTVSGQPSQTVTLDSPGDDMVMYGGLADGDYQVAVTGNGDQLAASIQTIANCDPQSSIDIMLSVNGDDADNPTGPVVLIGENVTLDYKVTNTGDTPLSSVGVTDDEIGVISCPQDTLAVGEMMTCSITVAATGGQFSSIGTVSGSDPSGDGVSASDPGNYFASEVIITIEKATNGQDADAGTGPIIAAGDPVTWTYVVSNGGNVQLTNVQVDDDREGAISCPESTLGVGQSMTCQKMGIAVEGQYTNMAMATGTPPSGPNAVATDSSNYFGSNADIDITKTVNGADANNAPFPTFDSGQQITFEYVVTNSGNVVLTGVVVEDSMAGTISCPKAVLEPAESMTCSLPGLAETGEQSMTATVQGTPPSGPVVNATDGVTYVGVSSGIDVAKTTNGGDGLQIPVGDAVVWEYTVKNESNVTLNNIVLTDDPEGAVQCPESSLLADETMVCQLTGEAGVGAYSNTVTATGSPEGGGAAVTDTDSSSYTGVTGSLGDRVWVDLDGDGLQGPGEPGVGGITVNLWTDDDENGTPDTQVTSTVTDSSGNYVFPGLSSNVKYIIQVEAPAGSFTTNTGGDESNDSNIDPASGISDAVMVPANGSNFTVDAGLLPASLGDKVFLDSNSNGQQDDGEAGVNGIVVNLWLDTDGDGGPDGQAITQTVTDSQGMYSFAGLDPTETYIVQFVTDRVFTTANEGDDTSDSDAAANGITGPYNLSYGENNTTVDAGIVDAPGGTIGDIVFSDANENCVADAGEGIGGVTVNLLDSAGNVVSTEATGPDGTYSFSGIAAGDYTVMVDVQTLDLGFVDTCDHNNEAAVSLASGQVIDTADFGFAQCATIGNFVFNDANRNGIQDGDEPGLSGVTVEIWTVDADGNPVERIDTATSASDGSYAFCVDPSERYVIKVNARLTEANVGDDDSIDSDIDPVSGLSAVIDPTPGSADNSIDIGVVPPEAPLQPAVEIVSTTNGGDGVEVAPGGDLALVYMVTNSGEVALTNVVVTDDVYGAVSCPQTTLAVEESMDCTLSETAGADGSDPVANVGSVTADSSEGAVSDADPTSHSVTPNPATPVPTPEPTPEPTTAPTPVPAPAISIVTETNGSDGPTLDIGTTATITYVVTNTGNVDLSSIQVTDDELGAISCPADSLAPGESFTCQITTTVTAGLFENVGSVTATSPNGPAAIDASDPTSHSGQEVQSGGNNPSIDIETLTNNVDADIAGSGPQLGAGSTVTYSYLVTNNGDVTLDNISVVDDRLGQICSIGTLTPNQTFTCSQTGTVAGGLFVHTGFATGTPANGGAAVSASDPTNHTGLLAQVATPTPAPTSTPTAKAAATPTAKKEATPTPKKATPLAVTGSDSRELALIAVGAIAAGAALVGIGRRRREAEL